MGHRHRRLALLIGLFLTYAASVSDAEDRRPTLCRLSVMTFNAEFLWDGTAPEEGQATFPWRGSPTEAQDHMRRVAEVIIRGNPDIINLVEVENLDALTLFNTQFLAGRGYRPYLVTGTDTFTGQDVALLTRIDPENNTIQRDDRKGQAGTVQKAVSKNYFAKLLVDNTKIALVGVHFLAFPLNESRRLEREAQADAMRRLALELRAQGHQVIVLGDFNDYDGDTNSRDHRDNMPVTNVLRNLKAMDPAVPDDDLTNAATFVPKAVRYTAFHDANQNGQVDFPNEVTSIDHILLAHELAERVDVVEIPHDHDPRQVSDHFPLVARFRLCETGPTPPPGGPGTVRLISLLPNPPGDDTQNEEATLKNFGGQPASLAGWQLRDLSGRTWTLDALGTLQPGEEKTVRRQGQPMALNNRGDTIDVLDAAGSVVQTVTYGAVQEGEVVTVGN